MDDQRAPALSPDGVPQNERLWATFAHLSALLGYVAFPIGFILGPLIIWLIKRNEMPFLDDQGKEAINFQITMTLAAVVAGILVFAVVGFVLLPVIAVIHLILVIVATIKSNEGVAYRYPLCLRLVK